MHDLKSCSDEVRSCQLCRLSKTRTQAVPGDGSPVAQILFVGEAPGLNEDRQGIPFVGAAGRILDNMLKSVALDRESVFITNIVKCRPPNNRDPLPDESEACSDYLDRQIEILRPSIIVPLGRHAASHWFPKEPISKLRAQARSVGELTLFPLYHPAAALHNGKLRKTIQSDFLKLGALLASKTNSGKNAPALNLSSGLIANTKPAEAPAQMRML